MDESFVNVDPMMQPRFEGAGLNSIQFGVLEQSTLFVPDIKSITEYDIGDSLVRLPLLCSGGRPDAFAIDLTSLIEFQKGKQKRNGRQSFRNIAFLVIWEQLTKSITSDKARRYLARLQITSVRNSQFIQRTQPASSAVDVAGEQLNLQSLIRQAVEAVNQIPKSEIDFVSCKPFENYELESEPDEGDLAENPQNADTKSAGSSATYSVVQRDSSHPALPNCSVGAHYSLSESAELCTNQHRACLPCVECFVSRKLESLCCGISEDEVCWKCPVPRCNAPLLRLAQLQAVPLQQLASVWKCDDYMCVIREKRIKHGGKQPVFYANPKANPSVALSVWSGPMRTFASRKVEVFFEPAPVAIRCLPRLYFNDKRHCEIHWPASCEAAQKYYRMRDQFGDSNCVFDSTPAALDRMQPYGLPLPGGARTRSYCNALRVAWRRNVLWRRHFKQNRVWTEFEYGDILPAAKYSQPDIAQLLSVNLEINK
ncbi:unnamed protein product [Echinostoma caproni]|uniref:Vertnin n=1 Tax=Echinostoma caproni TaxID=27848 RepID=A0A183AYW4_9TREM|nr:unnamed protein product [Echinostoma caproni]